MAKQTVEQQLAEGLTILGYSEYFPGASRRYRWFKTTRKDPQNRKPIYYFVGPSGALRWGTAPSNSFCCVDAFRATVLEAGPKARALALSQLGADL